MAEGDTRFDYVAIDAGGKRVRGSLAAGNQGAAFERLKRDGLSPLKLHLSSAKAADAASSRGLGDRDTAALLSDLAALLGAGADMRSALAILGGRGGKPTVRLICRRLSADIAGGQRLDKTFAAHLGKSRGFVAALIAAGETSGDLAGGFRRASEVLEAEIKLRDQLVSVLSYPVFVLATTILAMGVILFLVVPSLAPLAEENGSTPPLSLAILIGLSGFLRENAALLGAVGLTVALVMFLGFRLGVLREPLDRLLLDGPFRRTVRGLTFGAFAISLGNMLASGAPMGDALRLAVRSVRSKVAQRRLEAAGQAVRQGEALSLALERTAGFPSAIVRLATVGESTGALGVMVARAGKFEEDSAIRRIQLVSNMLGPALIVVLGGLIGLVMAGLLSGVSQLGQTALQ